MKKLLFFLFFTICIVLFSASVNAELIPVFDENVNFSYDDFEGNNGDPWNTSLWTQTLNPNFLNGDNNAEIFNNKGRLNADADGSGVTYNWMTTDQNIWTFEDGDDINFSFIYSGSFRTGGLTKPRALIHDTNGTRFANDCTTDQSSTHPPIVCISAGDENGFFVDGNTITTSPIEFGSKIVFNLKRISDTNNYDIILYLDLNKEVDLTITRPSVDLNFSFACMSSSNGDDAQCDFENLDINGQKFSIRGVEADFTQTPSGTLGLDPGQGINSIIADFNETSIKRGITDTNFFWFVDSNLVSTDQNTTHNFLGAGDFNVSLVLHSTDGSTNFRSQKDSNVLVRNTAQNIDINFSRKPFVNNASLTFGVTADGAINFAVWGFPNDQNLTGINVDKNFTTDGIKQVCVVVNSSGDVNKLVCENFTSTRVLVKKPKDKISGTFLTPFDVSTNDITRQSYLNQSADLNVFLFFESGNDQNVLFTVDFNADYFSSTFLIQTNDSETFRTIQPLLVLISESVSAVFHVINAITQNTIPDVVIESRQGGVLIESTITDSTGSATLNFIVGDTYNLTFKFRGVVSLEQEIRPIDTEYFIYLFLEDIITEPEDPETITITFDPSIGQVQERDDGNFTLTQTVTATRNSITLINIQVNQNGVSFFDSNFTGASGGTFSQDFNALIFASDSPIRVTVTVTSSLIDKTQNSISYFIQFTSQATFLNAINALGVNLGDVGRIVLVVLSSFVIVGGFSQATRNPHILGAIVIIWLGFFTAIGLNENYVIWVPVPVFLFALIGAVTFYLNR